MTEIKIGEYIRHVGKLIQTEDVTPPVVRTIDYIFEQVSAKCELRLGQEVVKDIQTLNDFYGEGTGVATAIEEMKEYAAQRKLGPASELEVVVIRIAEQYRMRHSQYEGDRVPFRALDNGCRYGLPEPTKTVVWSSKQHGH